MLMMRWNEWQRIALTSGLAMLVAGAAVAQETPGEGPMTTTALIHVESKNDVPLDPKLLTIEVNGKVTPVINVMQVKPSTAQLAILIDDGLRGSFGNQVSDVMDFIGSLPPGLQVMVGYMRDGTVITPHDSGFSADHSVAADSLRIPLSSAGVSASPYFCLSDFVKHWPSNQPAARFVLMLTNGVDPYNGSTSIMNQDSPYVQTAQEDAERAGVAVYSIYFGDAGIRGGRANVSGQSYLYQVASSTGAESFYQGQGNPVQLAPYLNDLRKHIAESYTISFMASAHHEKADTIDRIKLKTSQPGVKIQAPENVHPGVNLE